MGLLDNFSFDDPKNQGLLAAAAQMLQQSGSSRMPVGLGQIMGGGLSAFSGGMQAAQQRKLEEQQQQQMAQMRGLQIQEAQGGLQDHALERQKAEALRQFYMKQGGSGLPAQGGAGALPAASIGAGEFYRAAQSYGLPTDNSGLNKIVDLVNGGMTPVQAASSLAGKNSPTEENSQLMQSASRNAAPIQSTAPGGNQKQDVYEQRMALAQQLRSSGFPQEADAQEAAALKFKPKFATEFRQAVGADGKLHNYQVAEDGQIKEVALGVKPDMVEVGLGNRKQFVDKNSLTSGQSFTMGQSPDSVASNSLGYARLNFDKKQAEASDDAAMDPLAIRMTAQQYLAGDSAALQNFGRGAQGSKNLNAVRLEVAKQATAAGMNGADIAAKMAEFGGVKAGQRTAGTRSASIEIAASEAAELAPLAIEASRKVARSGFLPFGKAQVMFDQNTNDPNLRQFAMANTALSNAYSQVMSRGGVATVSDKEHARELLSTAYDQPSYEAAVAQLTREIQAAQKAPGAVKRAISAGVTGKDEHGAPAAPAVSQFSVAAPNGKTYNFNTAKDLANFKLSAGIK